MRNAIRSLAFLLFVLAAGPSPAQVYKAGEIAISEPRVRATPVGATVSAGYMLIENRGAAPDRLIEVRSALAPRIELHETRIDGGIARMRPLAGGLQIGAQRTVRMEPGGYHVMFMDLQRRLQTGDRFKATLVFERAGAVEIEFAVHGIERPRHGH